MFSDSDILNQQEVESEKLQALCPVSGCALATDIIIKSSDGKLFGAHSENLAGYSGGFPPTSFASSDAIRDPVELPERSLVIEYMLNYMHNHRLAMLKGLSSEDVNDIAYAAEKYFIYSLMEVCRLYMYRLLRDDPMMVLAYAAKHSHDDLFDEAVPMTLRRSLEEIYVYLGASVYFVAWVRYRERFLRVRDAFRRDPPVVKHKGGLNECALWSEFVAQLLRMEISEISEWETVMRNLANAILEDCSWCSRRAEDWVARIYGIALLADIRFVKASSLK
ncbi:hypothetical protein APHAL10511_003505 [Amanita phalloides]|nr:hypothetical protein APHAL10511_003505 [Amanita phalloides]